MGCGGAGLNVYRLAGRQVFGDRRKPAVSRTVHGRRARQGDPGFGCPPGGGFEHLQLRRVEVVEAIHDQQGDIR